MRKARVVSIDEFRDPELVEEVETEPISDEPPLEELFEIEQETDLEEEVSTLDEPDNDIVRKYLVSIGGWKILKMEDEARLGKRILKGDLSARNELVEHNLRLVIAVAKKYTRWSGMDFLELIEEGNVGMMKGEKKFDYRKGFKFSTCAMWWIRQQITRAIADKSRTIRVPVHMNGVLSNVRKAIRKIAAGESIDQLLVSPEAIMAETGKSRQEILRALDIMKRCDVYSLEHPVGYSKGVSFEDSNLGDLVKDDKPDAVLVSQAAKELRNLVCDHSNFLSSLRKIVSKKVFIAFCLRYGMNDGSLEHKILEEIGDLLNFTREMARQSIESVWFKHGPSCGYVRIEFEEELARRSALMEILLGYGFQTPKPKVFFKTLDLVLKLIVRRTRLTFNFTLQEFVTLYASSPAKQAAVFAMRQRGVDFNEICAVCMISKEQAQAAFMMADMEQEKNPNFREKLQSIARPIGADMSRS